MILRPCPFTDRQSLCLVLHESSLRVQITTLLLAVTVDGKGRYKAFLVEDAGYYWTLSRDIHLTPCLGGKPLATDPESWPHSSMAGCARRSKRVDWVEYDQLHTYWNAAVGGKDAAGAYRRCVNEGLVNPVDPFKQPLREWVFGSEDFLRRLVAMAEGGNLHRHESTIRRVHGITVTEILEATASHHGVNRSEYAAFRSAAAGRDMAAWLCRRWTGVTLRELGPGFGLTGTASVSNLVRRAEQQSKRSANWRKRASEIEAMLHLNTAHNACPGGAFPHR